MHEKNVRHGHISTLHIWPARRPLAACRAALIATLLPDPSAEPRPDGMSDEAWQAELARKRREFCEKIGGTVEKIVDSSGRVKEVTKGGVLHLQGKEGIAFYTQQKMIMTRWHDGGGAGEFVTTRG
jgi:hypothetical protein